MEENKGQVRPSESGTRSNERTSRRRETESRFSPESRGNEDSGSRINEADRTRDHKDSDADVRVNLQQQRLRDVELQQRRSHETESRFWQRQRDRSTDWRERSESRRRFDERTQGRHESSAYPRSHRSVKDCRYFLRNGQCRYGTSCFYNHPSHIPQARTTNRRASEYERRFDETTLRRYETESRPRAEWRMEEREGQDNLQEQRQRDNMERQRRENQQRLREVQEIENVDTRDQQNQEEQSRRDIERERREARSSLDQVKCTVEFNDLSEMRDTLRDLGIKRKEGDGF